MLPFTSLSDYQLLDLIDDGDEQAFNVIYERYSPLLYIYGCKIITDSDDVKDILQEIFISLWTKKSVQINTSFSAFIYSAMKYKLFDYIDKQKVRQGYAASLQEFISKGEYVTDNQVLENELAAQIEKEIDNLPPKMREVFILSRKANQSYQEIADQLNISDKTVKKQISNALKIMRSKLTSLFF